jgi:hypothetical protein
MRAIMLFMGFCWVIASGNIFAAPSVTVDEERLIIRSLAPFAKREGKVLTLRATAGRATQLTDSKGCNNPETCIAYRLLGTSRDNKFFVVESLGWEWNTVFWIEKESGKRYEVIAKPEMSPNGRWIVTANPAECCSTNGVFIWQVQRNHLVERLHFVPTEYALYTFVRWDGNDNVVLEKFARADNSICSVGQFMKLFVTVTRQGNNWKFDENSGLKSVVCQ